MLARERQSFILNTVQRTGSVRIHEVALLLSVSDMTVRRDLEQLARKGLLDKVHGGALPPSSRSADEPGFDVKVDRAKQEKQAIADLAAELVSPGSSVALTAGTTTFVLAHRLREVRGITVVTNSMRIAAVLQGHRSDQTIVLTGGVRTPSDALVGPVAVASLNRLHVDLVFMGVHGMTAKAGFTTPNLAEVDTNRAFLSSARRCVVLADHTKWDVSGLSSIAHLTEVDTVICDDQLSEAGQRALRAATNLLLAHAS